MLVLVGMDVLVNVPQIVADVPAICCLVKCEGSPPFQQIELQMRRAHLLLGMVYRHMWGVCPLFHVTLILTLIM